MFIQNSRKSPKFGLKSRHSAGKMPEQVFNTCVVLE
jgi:hypothetical protein